MAHFSADRLSMRFSSYYLVLVKTLLWFPIHTCHHTADGPRTRPRHTHKPATTSWHFTPNCLENSGQVPHALSVHHDAA